MLRSFLRMPVVLALVFVLEMVKSSAQAQGNRPIEPLMREIQARWKEVSHQEHLGDKPFAPETQRAIKWTVGSYTCPDDYPPDGYFSSRSDVSKSMAMNTVIGEWDSKRPYRFFLRPNKVASLTAVGATLQVDDPNLIYPGNEFNSHMLRDYAVFDLDGITRPPTFSVVDGDNDVSYNAWYDWFDYFLPKLYAFYVDPLDGYRTGDLPSELHRNPTSGLGNGLEFSRYGHTAYQEEPDCNSVLSLAWGRAEQSNVTPIRSGLYPGVYEILEATEHRSTSLETILGYSGDAQVMLHAGTINTTFENADHRAHCGKGYVFLAICGNKDGLRPTQTEPFPPPVTPTLNWNPATSTWDAASSGWGILHSWKRELPIGQAYILPLVPESISTPLPSLLSQLIPSACPAPNAVCSGINEPIRRLNRACGWFAGYINADMRLQACPAATPPSYGDRSATFMPIIRTLKVIESWDTHGDRFVPVFLPQIKGPILDRLKKLQRKFDGLRAKYPWIPYFDSLWDFILWIMQLWLQNGGSDWQSFLDFLDSLENPHFPCPVLAASGDKMEQVEDLRVLITGGAFVVNRGYVSTPNLYDSPGYGLAGANWSLSLFQNLRILSGSNEDPTTILVGDADSAGEWALHRHEDASGIYWKTEGNTTQRLTKETVFIDGASTEVWRLSDPGVGSADFYRGTATNGVPAELNGFLVLKRDVYGLTNRYRYTSYLKEGGFAGERTCRLTSVDLNAVNSGHPDATIVIDWGPLCESSSIATKGRVRSMSVLRYYSDGNPSAEHRVVTDRVVYTYRDSTDLLQQAHADVGTDGDLIQVTKYQIVDREVLSDPPGGTDDGRRPSEASGLPKNVRITQYRYHDGAQRTSSTDERLATFGRAHQLKSVILPEQIEFLAQERQTQSLESVARDFLRQADGAAPYVYASAGRIAADYSAKIITYETAITGRVTAEYVQTSCGCAGASQGLKQAFAYSNGTSGPVMTTQEYQRSGSAWTAFRTVTYETELQGTDSVPYLKRRTFTEPGTNGRSWAWGYEYDSKSNLKRLTTPASNASGGASGLMLDFTYNDDNRLIECGIRNGVGGTLQVLSRVIYPAANGPSQRTYLPIRLERYSDPQGITPDTTETVELSYGFTTNNGVPTDAIAWTQVATERESVSENGPSQGNVPSLITLFDASGQPFWMRRSDNTLVWQSFDASTGVATRRVENADPAHPGGMSNPSLPSGSYFGLPTAGWGMNGSSPIEGGELSVRTAVDLLGRVTLVEGPGGVKRAISREIRANNARPGPLYYATTVLPAKGAQSGFEGPATVNWFNASGRSIRSSEFSVASMSSLEGTDIVDSYAVGQEVARTVMDHDLSGLLTNRWRYSWVDGRIPPYRSIFSYDALGRLVKYQDDGLGTITKNSSLDIFGRVLEVQVGTDDSSSTGNMRTVASYTYDGATPGSQGVGNGNITAIVNYTGESGALGPSLRTTTRQFDFRDRLTSVTSPAAPQSQVAVFAYDNLDRVVEESLYDRTPISSAVRGAYTRTKYSQRGLAYRSETAIDPQSPSSFLSTHVWYDDMGRPIEQWGPSGPAIKRKFDGLGRVVQTFVTDRGGDPAPGTQNNYAAAESVDNDIVLEQSEPEYSKLTSSPAAPEKWLGLPRRLTTRQRLHDATSTGQLTSSNSITTYQDVWYDEFRRPIRSANYGTNDNPSGDGIFRNGSSAPAIPTESNVPYPSWNNDQSNYDSARLLTAVEYDHERGLPTLVRDPNGRVSRYQFDHLGRRYVTIENATSNDVSSERVSWDWPSHQWTVPPSQLGLDRITRVEFDARNAVTRQVVYNAGLNAESVFPQVTDYVYGTTAGSASDLTASLVASKGLLAEIRYPSRSDGQATGAAGTVVKFAYNILGELRSTTDQNGTRHEYLRDSMGRTTADRVGVFGTDSVPNNVYVDTRVNRINYGYDAFGRLSDVTSGSGANGATIVNAVRMTYTPMWQIEKVLQDHDGAVQVDSNNNPLTSGNTQLVSYTYTNSPFGTGGNYSRMTRLTYPDGSYVNTLFGTSASLDDRISRATGISDFTGKTPSIVEYTRIGVGLPVVVDYPLADVQLDRTLNPPGLPAGTRNANGHTYPSGTPSMYPGLDRYGRVIQQAWIDGDLKPNTLPSTEGVPNIPPIVHEGFGYRGTYRTSRTDLRPGKVSTLERELYTHDGLNRLKTASRQAMGSGGNWAAIAGGQSWSLDLLGNWEQLYTDTQQFGTFDNLDRIEARDGNAINELTQRTINNSTPLNLSLNYDLTGNLRYAARQASPTSKDTYTYDAWNRMVKHSVTMSNNASYDLATYEYNGLHMRTKQLTGMFPSQVRFFYYSADWRLIEEHVHDDAPFGEEEGGMSPGTNKVIQEVFGFRHIDDPVLRRVRNAGEGAIPLRWNFSTTTDTSYYHLTDPQFSTQAMIGTGQKPSLYERVRYEPYGTAHHRWGGDVDGDGDSDVNDKAVITGLTGVKISDGGYHPDADRNRDGVIDSNDVSASPPGYQAGLGAGMLSAAGYADNVFGYGGYMFAPPSMMYSVRHRWYSPELGRWTRRDPMGYVDGGSLYEYVGGGPMGGLDPMGLWGEGGPGMLERAQGWVSNNGNRIFGAMRMGVGGLVGVGAGLTVLEAPPIGAALGIYAGSEIAAGHDMWKSNRYVQSPIEEGLTSLHEALGASHAEAVQAAALENGFLPAMLAGPGATLYMGMTAEGAAASIIEEEAAMAGAARTSSCIEMSEQVQMTNAAMNAAEGESAIASGEAAEMEILFGQRRIDPKFSNNENTPSFLRNRSIGDVAQDLRSGVISTDQMRIEAFEHAGQMVTANNRSLAALAEAGLKPTNITIIQPSFDHMSRLTESSLIGSSMPGRSIPVTPSRGDPTIIRIISIPPR